MEQLICLISESSNNLSLDKSIDGTFNPKHSKTLLNTINFYSYFRYAFPAISLLPTTHITCEHHRYRSRCRWCRRRCGALPQNLSEEIQRRETYPVASKLKRTSGIFLANLKNTFKNLLELRMDGWMAASTNPTLGCPLCSLREGDILSDQTVRFCLRRNAFLLFDRWLGVSIERFEPTTM